MKRITAALLAVALVAGSCATSPSPDADEDDPDTAHPEATGLAGTWSGGLTAGGATLRIVFRISRDASGGYTALLDSPDQNARDIPVSSVAVNDKVVRLEVAVAGASYEGTLDAAGDVIEGTWTQGGARLPLTLTLGEPPTPRSEVKPGSADIGDTWSGKLNAGAVLLRMVFRISRDESGRYTALLDSPDEGLRDISVSGISVNGDAVRLELAAVGAVFEGTLNPEATTIVGAWSQRGGRVPLTLERGEVAVARRPQVPVEPYPYLVREFTTRNEPADVTLAGTLTMPSGAGPFSAVVLISGSGQQNRDEELFGHKPFLVLADALTRAGLAVARYDDRGVGGSTGNPGAATTRDFAGDALAVFRYLAEVQGVDPRRVGLVGHSEGGQIACMLAASTPDVAFAVLLAGPGLPGDEILLLQTSAILRASGQGEEAVAADRELRLKLHAAAKADTDLAQARADLGSILRSAGVPENQIETALGQFLNPWMRFFLRYDPRADLERIRQPLLALVGSKDVQVPARENLAAIREALDRAGNRKVTALEMHGLNHLFQTATTGLPAEYGAIEETMAPVVLDTIGRWILGL